MKLDPHKLIEDFVLYDRRLGEWPGFATDLRVGAFEDQAGTELMRPLMSAPLPSGYARVGLLNATLAGTITLLKPAPPLEDPRRALDFLALLLRYLELTEEERRDLLTRDPQSGFSKDIRFGHLFRALKQIRESVGGTGEDVAAQIGTTSKTLSQWEMGVGPPGFETMHRWCRALGIFAPPRSPLVRVVDFSPELLRFLQEDPTRLRSLTPDQFEHFVAERLDRMGYSVTLTGATNRKDGGIDLIAVPKLVSVGSVVIAGQMKHHVGDDRTGREAVDRLLAWKDSYFGVGLLVTNTSFTRDAFWKAQQERNARFLRLRDLTDLKRWLEDQYSDPKDWREIPTQIELAPGVVIRVPRPRIVPPEGGGFAL